MSLVCGNYYMLLFESLLVFYITSAIISEVMSYITFTFNNAFEGAGGLQRIRNYLIRRIGAIFSRCIYVVIL